MSDRVTIGRSLEALVHRHAIAGTGRPDVLVGLVGRGIQLSRSPVMHESEAARLGLSCAYVLIDFDALRLDDGDLAGVLDAAARLGFRGVNVTYPFKQAVLPLLDDVAPEAGAIGAVNTVVFGQMRVGHNTDCWGFAESFRRQMADVPLGRVAVFGAGGAGSAVATALVELGAREIAIVDSDDIRADELVRRLGGGRAAFAVAQDARTAVLSADGLVNTTPVGMARHPGTPFPPEFLHAGQWVADVIYFPQETELLRRARAIGCRTLPGTGMAVGQAARAFELFTGRAADMGAMADHFGAAA
ncbi:shikimate dehydrogenase (NADP(+)) [Mesorhizobium sp. L-8-10]|uniref:shikimate dehydrogenase n=1 Tax=Mesorhizobium sp. L-8-10 TaxID=2744523 RepID=UPI001929411F|nr:shikimate dehydrogenase [Mesorhizobium sp. L-8-10]BCH35232.1 shikimate dehydrogenase (NADP(+)) [Mesorhizobium sp. L-8-10]